MDLLGKTWTRLFLKRHPKITVRRPEFVSSASSKVCPEDIKRWFTNIEDHLESQELQSILADPQRIINGDETSFQLNPKTKVVLALRGCHNVYDIERSSSKVNITTMFSFLATGDIVPPTVIYPYKSIPQVVAQSVPASWGIARSDSGWMTANVFRDYIRKVLNPYLEERQIKKPVIYIVDGHSSHINLETSLVCRDLGIILVALYPNVTHIMQPADVAAFKPLKVGWPKTVKKFRTENSNLPITPHNFAGVLQDCIRESLTVETIKNGFRASGLYPWNYQAIDFSKFLGKSNTENEIAPHDSAENCNDEIEGNVEMLDARVALKECAEAIGFDAIRKFRGDFVCFQNDDEGVLFKVYQVLQRRCPDILDSIGEQVEQVSQMEEFSTDDIIIEQIDCTSPNVVMNNQEHDMQREPTVDAIDAPGPSRIPLRECLKIPPVPQRGNKREYKSKRFHVLTSDEFIEEFQQKEDDRKEEEEGKENRKVARMQKKIDTEIKKKQRDEKKENKGPKSSGQKKQKKQ